MSKKKNKKTNPSPKIEKIKPEEIAEVILAGDLTAEKIESFDKDLAKKTLKSIVLKASSMSYSGPLPLASEMEHYEKSVPGSADRIIKMAESEQSHRHNIENTQLNKIGFERNYQLTLGAFLFAGLIGASVYTIIIGASIWATGLLLGTAVLGFLSKFIPNK